MPDFITAIANLDIDAEIAENNAAVAFREGRIDEARQRSESAAGLRKAQAVLEDLQVSK